MKKKILFAFALLVALVATTQNTFAQDHGDRHHRHHRSHHRMHHGNDGPRRDGDHHM